MSLFDTIAAEANRSVDRSAILSPGRPPLTYGDLRQHLRDIRGHLRAAGVGPEDRVAVVLPQSPELATAVLSIAASAACAPLNPAYQTAEYEGQLRQLRPKVVVVAEEDSPVRAVARSLGIQLIEVRFDGRSPAGLFTLRGSDMRIAASEERNGPERVALLLPTSGTTARSKLVPLSDGSLVMSAGHIASTLTLGPDDRCLDVMPLYHIHGLMMLMASMASGGSAVCPPALQARSFFEWLDEHRPTWYSAVPTMHQAIVAEAAQHAGVIARVRLRFVRSCSAPLPARVEEELGRVFGVPVISAYGMTEATHQVATNPLPPGVRKGGSVGRPTAIELAIVDSGGQELPAGVRGEVVIRGRTVMSGYVENPAANAAAFRDGWFRTGDEGFLDGDGYLFLTGRLKEVINRGGAKIAPAEVDEVLMAHPSVLQAVTFGVPHPTLGEDVAAVIVARPERTIAEDELRGFVAERLAEFKVPRRIVFRAEIPKGASGKLQRLGLAAKLGLAGGGGVSSPDVGGEEPSTQTEKAIARIWGEVLELDRVGIDQSFFALGGDSLRAVRVLNEIARCFGRQLPPSILLQAATVRALARLVDPAGGVATWTALVPLQEKGHEAPLYCVHQHTGQIFCYRDLARHLGEERPIYGLVPRGLDGQQKPWSSIEDMAAHYVREIRRLQPEGPYHVAGFCFGGVVAFEMAQQFRAQGQRVGLLALIQASWQGDLPAPWRWVRSVSRRMRFEMQQVAHRGRGRPLSYLARRIGTVSRDAWMAVCERMRKDRAETRMTESPVELAIRRVEAANDEALAQYRPRAYPDGIVLFRSERVPASFHGDPSLGWTPLAAGGLQVHEIHGDRPNVVDEPDVRLLAEKLRNLLSKSTAGTSGRP